MNKEILIFSIYLFLGFSLTSCAKKYSILGEYKSTDKNQTSTLILNLDGTFVYSKNGGNDGCGVRWRGSNAHGTWNLKNKTLRFLIDSTMKPQINYVQNSNETLKVTFKDSEGNDIRSRTTVGVNHKNTIINSLDSRRGKTNNFETSNFQNIDKIMVYLLGSETYLFIPTDQKAKNIEVENFHDYVYYELEEADFKVSRNTISGIFMQEYANHGKRELNKRELKFEKSL